MNKNIDLTQILKGCPKGIEFYSPMFGPVYFRYIDTYSKYPIEVACTGQMGDHARFTSDGRFFAHYDDAECMLFPSKDNRDWSKFTAPWYKKEKFDPKTLKPFDKVLGRNVSTDKWGCTLFSNINVDAAHKFHCVGSYYKCCIPYNDDTKHLVGTKEEVPEFYRYWED